jgi:serine/threonine-protein kinase mTOR
LIDHKRLVIQYKLYFAYVKLLWATDRRDEAMERLRLLCDVVDMVFQFEKSNDFTLRIACWQELGEWLLDKSTSPNSRMSLELQTEVLALFRRSTHNEKCGYKSWHNWAQLNFRIALQYDRSRELRRGSDFRNSNNQEARLLRHHVVSSVRSFVNAINLGTRRWSASVQQDLLNLLTCLFKFGDLQDVAFVFNETISTVAVEAWLGVLPQLLARIHIKDPAVRSVLHPLLVRLGEKHPQALMYPLSVLLKSPVVERRKAAISLMNSLKGHSSALVEEALMVSSELIRVAILWLETWHEGLEDASRLYFGEGNTVGMLELLLPLHEAIEKGGETIRENEFLDSFGQDLAQAHAYVNEYSRLVSVAGEKVQNETVWYEGHQLHPNDAAESAMNRAWDIYYTVFRRINKQLPSLTKLELDRCSPALSRARSLELGVPGSYRVDGSFVNIERFNPSLSVITSKQRPRKITLQGSDGHDYVFLLKGHEDLRQDERVMQLFGLVNALLTRKPETKKHDLRIQRYGITPLSQNCGLVGWVPHTDTLHSLIRDYRHPKRVPLNMENREMQKIAIDYDILTGMQKVEVFIEALSRTNGNGNDLYEILWMKSTNSEEWLERRTRFTRSLAVMSMVGYILGLGDRHPSNLMLDKLSGRILHIDFGDCFEVAMKREKFPEKVPFRLTRMLVKAMEVSGIEGSYRSTCERTMSVLRSSRDSLVTMLEAFVYDPLISWRLVDLSPPNHDAADVGNGNELSRGLGWQTSQSGTERFGEVEVRANILPTPISENSDEDTAEESSESTSIRLGSNPATSFLRAGMSATTNLRSRSAVPVTAMSASRARSQQMYSNIQAMALNISTESRIRSITGPHTDQQMAVQGSMARSRMERSMRQREFLSILGGRDRAAHEEALNEKALKVIRRVQDKLTGTDFPDSSDGEPLSVPDQIQRLIVQATSCENLCQLFIGWCAFW